MRIKIYLEGGSEIELEGKGELINEEIEEIKKVRLFDNFLKTTDLFEPSITHLRDGCILAITVSFD